MHGYKTKLGILLIITASVVSHISFPWALSLLCLGTALGFYGIYDRGNRNKAVLREYLNQQLSLHMDDLRTRLKKPTVVR